MTCMCQAYPSILTTTEAGEVAEKEKDPLTHIIIGAAIEVHRILGPGLLESAYEACLKQRQLRTSKTLASVLQRCGLRLWI